MIAVDKLNAEKELILKKKINLTLINLLILTKSKSKLLILLPYNIASNCRSLPEDLSLKPGCKSQRTNPKDSILFK